MSAEVLEKGCETGNLEDVKRAITSGVDPKLPLDHQLSETPLHIACRYVIAGGIWGAASWVLCPVSNNFLR